MPTGKDSSKNDMEKLLSIEAEVKIMADQLDKDKALFEKEKKAELNEIAAEREKLDKDVAKFAKTKKVLSQAESFNHMVRLVDEIYTMYVTHHQTPTGLYESIKLLLDARSKFTSTK